MIHPTELRKDIYKVLDQALETGKPVEMAWRGRLLRIVLAEPQDKFQQLIPRPDVIQGDPDDLIHINWNALLS